MKMISERIKAARDIDKWPEWKKAAARQMDADIKASNEAQRQYDEDGKRYSYWPVVSRT